MDLREIMSKRTPPDGCRQLHSSEEIEQALECVRKKQMLDKNELRKHTKNW